MSTYNDTKSSLPYTINQQSIPSNQINQQQADTNISDPTHRYDRQRPIPLSFCESQQKYKPQSNSIAGG